MKRIIPALLLLIGLVVIAPAQAAAQAPHQVTFNWTIVIPAGTTVTGFNVYRLTGTCPVSPSLTSFTKVGTALPTATSFLDTSVTAGTNYCYTVTSTTAGGESGIGGATQVGVPITILASISPTPIPGGATAQ